MALMTYPSLRRSLFDRTWSIVSPVRSRRPQPGADRKRSPGVDCPFCEGNESETEHEVFAVRREDSRADTPGWTIRVVPNKFPALSLHAPHISGPELLYQTAAHGFHEVVIETPQHELRLGQSSLQQLETILTVYQSRARILSGKPGVGSVVVLRNEGAAAGASQEHPHSQILALPLVPSRLAGELAEADRHFRERGRCPTCEMVDRERADARRVVVENADFIALTSFAPRCPYETWIVPRVHASDFRDADGHQLKSLASVLKQVLTALETAEGLFPYNLVLQTAPVEGSTEIERAFHWRLEVLPRLTTLSGFELGCDVFIVTVAPEEAAERLRAILK
jgi:UDPglucose--hexose-1-phosphate uridylyltransferase